MKNKLYVRSNLHIVVCSTVLKKAIVHPHLSIHAQRLNDSVIENPPGNNYTHTSFYNIGSFSSVRNRLDFHIDILLDFLYTLNINLMTDDEHNIHPLFKEIRKI